MNTEIDSLFLRIAPSKVLRAVKLAQKVFFQTSDAATAVMIFNSAVSRAYEDAEETRQRRIADIEARIYKIAASR
jgi:hypothetical protein